MTKEDVLEIIKLLSALESWSYAEGRRLPEYLLQKMDKEIEFLSKELLK